MKMNYLLLVVLLISLTLTSTSYGAKENAIVKSYRQAIAANPNDVIAHYNLGLSLYQQGKLNESRKMLVKSVQVNQGDKAAHIQVDGLAYQLLGSIYLTSMNDPRRAIDAFKKSILFHPNDAETHYLLGLAYLGAKKNNEAIETLVKTTKLGAGQVNQKNNVYDAYLQLGRLYATNKELELSINAYQEALKINPKGKEALANLALVYHQKNDSTKTITILERLTKLDKQHFNAYYLLGLHYFKKKKYENMERAYKQAIKIKPDLSEAHYNLGMAYFLQTRYDLAIKELEKVVKLNPKDADAYNLLGQSQQRGIEAYLQQGMTSLAQEELPDAIKAFSHVLKIDPNHHKARVYLADSKQRLEKNYIANLNSADQLYKRGKLEAAYQKYEIALSLHRQSIRAKEGIAKTKGEIDKLVVAQVGKGKAAQRSGNDFEAIRLYESALKLKRNYQPAKIALAQLKKRMATRLDQAFSKAKIDVKNNNYNRAVKSMQKLLARAQKMKDQKREKAILRTLTRTNAKRKEIVDRYLKLGKQAFAAGNNIVAKKNFNQVLDLEPQHHEANRLIMKLTGTKSEAKVTAERIKATYYRGVDFYVNGKIEEAIKEWQKVVRLDPDNDDAKVNIKRAKIKLEAIRKLTGGQ